MVILNGDIITQSVRSTKSMKNKCCSIETVKKRLPITQWLPQYRFTTLLQDAIAGVTVGLTSIAQGLAYAVVAGLPAEYGLYSALMGGFVYGFLGGCKDVSVGPTAILSALISRYISGYNDDFAVLAAFLSGLIELAMGILHLGFLVQFISRPVIIGFTNAAAFQVAASQLKGLFGLASPSGNFFKESIENFIFNIGTLKLWDTILGFTTIVILIFLQWFGCKCSNSGAKSYWKSIGWYFSLSRNAIVVLIAIIIAYVFKLYNDSEPFTLVGDISHGLPEFRPPPLYTTIKNETLSFIDMVSILGPQTIIVPIVAILEIVAIASAFSGGVPIDANQEMIALGFSNILGSFFRGMPVTGAFSRAALNRASGAQTPGSGIFTGVIIVLTLSLLSSTFYFIPKAVLSGIIMTAMYALGNFKIMGKLFKISFLEFVVSIFTMVICLFLGLEYGLVLGVILQTLIILYRTSKPSVNVSLIEEKQLVLYIQLSDSLYYCSVEHVRNKILGASKFVKENTLVAIDGSNLSRIDFTIASVLFTCVSHLEKHSSKLFFINFRDNLKNNLLKINPEAESKFFNVTNISDLYSDENCIL